MHKDTGIVVSCFADESVGGLPVAHEIGRLVVVQPHIHVLERAREEVINLFSDVQYVANSVKEIPD